MKRENEREDEREDQGDHEKMKRDRDERKCFVFFLKNVWEPPHPPDELAQNVSNKNLFRTNYSSIFLSKVQIWPCFQCFTWFEFDVRAGTINSEDIFGRHSSGKRISNQESKRRKASAKGRWENATSGKQMDNVRRENHVVSVMIPRLETDAISGKRGSRPLWTKSEGTDWRKDTLKKFRQQRRGGKIPCRYFLRGKCTSPSCNCWHPPVCLNYKSESRCTCGEKCRVRHVEADGQPSKKSKKSGCERISGLIKGVCTRVSCVSRFSSEKIHSAERKEIWYQITPSNSPRARWYHIKTRERKGPSRGVVHKCEPHERNPCAPRFEERTHDETVHQEKRARRVARDLAKSVVEAQKILIKLRFLLSYWSQGNAGAHFNITRGTRIRGWFWSISAHAEQEDLRSDEMETLRRSRNPTTVVTAIGEVQTNEEARENVHDLDVFVTVQILDDTPAVPSLGKLC